jgi:hypothetical protein
VIHEYWYFGDLVVCVGESHLVIREDFTARFARGAEVAEDDDFLICREMAANQNHRAYGKLVGKVNSPLGRLVACAEGAGAFPLSSSQRQGKNLLLGVLCVSAVHK